MRRRYTEIEKNLMKDIANNLKKILKDQGVTQKDLSEKTGLSTSAISDYVTGKTLLSPGNLHLIADSLNVSKGDIDPTYTSSDEPIEKFNPLMIFELVDKYTDDEIIEKYHHQDDDGTLTEQQVRMHLQYVRFLKTQK